MPDFPWPVISVRVTWPGANIAEIHDGITVPIASELRSASELRRIESFSRSGESFTKFLFPFYKEKNIREILKTLNAERKNDAMLVGGCVRNFLNNEKIGDIDIATIFTPDEIIKKFSKKDFKIIKSGINHGTITLSNEGKNFEITTLREDVVTDGRHAKVSFTKDWKKDSERRDFTINSIYLDQNGKIFDPQNGVQNLKDKVVKFIGDPQKRIEEDYLRILRFLRFSIQYHDFSKDDQTFKIIKRNINGIIKLSKEKLQMINILLSWSLIDTLSRHLLD